MKNILITIATILLLASALDAQWINYQAAEFVIGQPDFTTNNIAHSATGLAGPKSVAIDFQHSKLYIGDASNHRVLRYAYPITGNQPTAELVFGQSDFTTDPVQTYYNNMGFYPAPTAKQILYPASMAIHDGDLWVLDYFNSRIVKFSQAYNQTVNNPNADLVIGQANFTSNDNTGCTSNAFNSRGMTIDGNGNLWIADAGNRRVLRFNDVSNLTNGASASGVLGQPDFTTRIVPSTPSQNKIGQSFSLCFDGTTLWVCDLEFNRILRFDNAAAKPDGANADGVLGQSSFTTSAVATTPSTFNQPIGVCADGKGNLYVSDQSNNRVVIFLNAASKINGANADNFLGQPSFYVNSYTNANSDGSRCFAYHWVSNLAIDNTNGKLFVVDMVRVLQFAASGTLTGINQKESPELKPFQLFNYPNPFNLTTTISFTLPSESFVSLVVFDDTGRQLFVLVSKELPAGSYEHQWEAIGLPIGVYLCRLQVGKFVETEKLILFR